LRLFVRSLIVQVETVVAELVVVVAAAVDVE